MNELFNTDRPEDVAWLCSLSESEIDMLINLKLLILQRAKMIGHEELAKKFDLKMLRAIALVSMEYLKAQVQESPLMPDVAKSAAFLDACNLLKCNNHEGVLSIEDLGKNLGIDFQKVMRRPRAGEDSKPKRQKVESREA